MPPKLSSPPSPLTPSPAASAAPAENASERSAAEIDALPIEKCFEELEEIVASLEGQATSLEESLRLFERGMALSARCSRELSRVEKRIQMIVEGNKAGEVRSIDFRPDSADSDSE